MSPTCGPRPRRSGAAGRRGPPEFSDYSCKGDTDSLCAVRHRRAIALPILALAAVTLAPTRPAAAPIQPVLSGYAVLGVSNVVLRPQVRVQSGSVGSTGGQLRLAAGVTVSGSAVADIVRVGSSVKVDPIFCRLVTGAAFGHGVVGGPSVRGAPVPACEPLVSPVVDPALLVPVEVTPGTTDVQVPPRTGTAPYPPGSYGAIVVGAGSLLQLAGGDYQVRSITIAPRGRLVCTAACRIGVLENVVLRRRAQIGAAAPTRAQDVRIDVAGAGAPVFLTGPQATVAATIFAPAGDVVLGRLGSYRGAFVGRTVKVRPRATMRADSAL
jgi:hypothetical protein